MRMTARRGLMLWVALVLVGPLFSLASPAVPPKGTRETRRVQVISAPPALITVTLQDDLSVGNDFAIEIRVSYGSRAFEYGSQARSRQGFDGVIMDLTREIGWKGKYLFTPYDNGGNGSRSRLDEVFTLRGGELEYVGGFPDYQPAQYGGCYDGKYFRDYYNKHELCSLTSHAGFPGLFVLLTESDGRFRVHVQRTWEANKKPFDEDIEFVDYLIKHGEAGYDSNDRSPVVEPLLRNAVIAKYCGKEQELHDVSGMARQWLKPAQFAEFSRVVEDTLPGELQKHQIEVKRVL
ncbi:MAG: hypothetical protein WBS54_13835 [Acidobacteriota bacterium]